ncbi:MAG: AzlC family ABC transporter permease [Lachnospiraceae bacterium]|nr:AzlC family ABC transporter permease [Lachnospiraceae bacterium]
MKSTEKTNKRRADDFRQGARDGIPIALGYFAVSFAFGMAAARDGIGAFYSALTSFLCLSSAGQFAGMDVIVAGGSLIELALTQLVINLRYLLMSFSLSAKLSPKTGIAPRLVMAHGVTDEIFAISAARQDLTPYYTWGAMSVAVPGWTAGALTGGILGDILPAFLLSAFGIAIYGMFLAIILPPAREDRAVLLVVLAAGAMRALFTWTPVLDRVSGGFAIIIVTVTVSGIAAFLHPHAEDASQENGEVSS